MRRWLKDIAHERKHGTTQIRPAQRLQEERLQALPDPWRGDIPAARPQSEVAASSTQWPTAVIERIAQPVPVQHPLAVYERLLDQVRDGWEKVA